MFDQIVTKLMNRLKIDSGRRGLHGTNDPAFQVVRSALLGEAETAVTVTDTVYTMHRWIVLTAIDPDYQSTYPVLVRAHLHKGANPETNWGCICSEVHPRLKELGWLGRDDQLTTVEVASWFTSRCSNLGDDAVGLPNTWAPAAVDSFASVPIAGDLGALVKTTPDEAWDSNRYEWFDLSEVPISGSIWRLSSTKTLWMFTRREDNRWEVTIVPKAGWPITYDDNEPKDFGVLLEGATEAYKLLQPVAAN